MATLTDTEISDKLEWLQRKLKEASYSDHETFGMFGALSQAIEDGSVTLKFGADDSKDKNAVASFNSTKRAAEVAVAEQAQFDDLKAKGYK